MSEPEMTKLGRKDDASRRGRASVPRSTSDSTPADSVLDLQRSAGNAAVTGLFAQFIGPEAAQGLMASIKPQPRATQEGAGDARLSQQEDVAAVVGQLTASLDALRTTRQRLDGSFDRYGLQVAEHLTKGLADVIGFGDAADRERLEQLRPNLFSGAAGTARDAASEAAAGVEDAGEAAGAAGRLVDEVVEIPGVGVTTLPRSAKTAGKFIEIGEFAAKAGTVTAKAVPIAGFVLGAGVSVFENIQANAKIDVAMTLSAAQATLQVEASAGLVALLNKFIFTKGSVLHQLKQYESQGESLEKRMEDRRGDLEHFGERLRSGGRVNPSDSERWKRLAAELMAEHERWAKGYEEARAAALSAISKMPMAMAFALGEAMHKYEGVGGRLPMGKYRAELARHRLVKKLSGQDGEIVGEGRATSVFVNGQTYPLRRALRDGARVGQAAKVTDVKFVSSPDSLIETWRNDSFELDVELGGFMTFVPSVVGLHMSDVGQRIAVDAGLQPNFVFQKSSIREGFALGTNPPAGKRVPSGTLVTIYISSGPVDAR